MKTLERRSSENIHEEGRAQETKHPVKQALKGLWHGWLQVAHFIGRVNTTILLTLFYVTFIGTAKIAAFVLRKDLLDEAWRDRTSYWRKREGFQVSVEKFLKPY